LSRWITAALVASAVSAFCTGAAAQTPRQNAGAMRAPRGCAAHGSSPRPLAFRITCLLDTAPFDRALWGVAIANPRGRIVFERNGDHLFVPASNVKLIVTAVAAALLPPDYRYRTSVYAAGAVDSGVVRGDLVLYGRGDPTLSARYFPSVLAAFDELADTLRARGITRITGDVVGDASYFDSATVQPSWEGYDLNWWYAAPVTALAFNDNSIDFVVTPGPIGRPPDIRFQPDLGIVQFTNRARTVAADSGRTLDFFRLPGTNVVWAEGNVPADAQADTEYFAIAGAPAHAAVAFRRSLQGHGIAVEGRTRATFDSSEYAAARGGQALAQHLSPPLPDILRPILETSQNWFAEMLLKTLGRELRGRGTWDAGLDVERRFLVDSLGVDSTMFDLADGSGLSTGNLIAPRAFVQLLERMRDHPRAGPFVGALPVAGETGTGKTRFSDSRLAGRVRAKTGSINRVNTLSGYLEMPDGRAWTFSIQLNNHTGTTREALARIDAIVAALVR
jgi:D-alanyl-D-alanine carboxypeptidase/D-alanyl-D-alanine-endopeptidase (penicillin-binding protein 4)